MLLLLIDPLRLINTILYHILMTYVPVSPTGICIRCMEASRKENRKSAFEARWGGGVLEQDDVIRYH